ncbi:MAG: antitoxin [Acidobacteria bacterium]|nr:antitoxin [Acidobacteriota bacterium]
MSKRLQVVVSSYEFEEIREASQAAGQTISEWVRSALRQARDSPAPSEIAARLAAIENAARYRFPTADLDEMLGETAARYAQGS